MKSSKKVWGIYNTLDQEKIEKLSEFELWMKIHSMNRDIRCMLNYVQKLNGKDVSASALIDSEFNLEYLIYYTKKFGVKFENTPTFGEHIKQSESFNKWYDFWWNYYNSKEYRKYREAKEKGIDISKYLPNVNWKESDDKKEGIQLQKAY